MIVLNAIFPLFALLVLGGCLRHGGMTTDGFLKASDRLVYFIFFPAMLFWKIGGASAGEGLDAGLCLAGLCGVGIVFSISLLFLRISDISRFQAGSFCQASFRFNTYIGMAVVLQVLGEEGIRHFGILAGVVIPVINVLCVSVLIWHSGREMAVMEKTRFFVTALLSNPLILACGAGFFYARSGWGFPAFIHNTFSLMTSAALPLALVSIGGSLRFGGMGAHVKPALAAAGLKLLLMPGAGFFLLKLFGVSGVPFRVGMIYFALPTSTAIYVLSSQLDSDTDLAAASVVVSTLGSFFSLSLVLLL